MPLTPRQKSIARRNQEMRDLANENEELRRQAEVEREIRERLVERSQKLDREVQALRVVPLEAIRAVLGAMPVVAAIEADVIADALEVHRWIGNVDKAARDRVLDPLTVATGNEAPRGQ